ncbi:MAG: PAS domain S-box protein [Candidatus Heimdallarchaeota archaeon]|nr:PAS domain S-box protein [Candidatus Heimdallarchaeota archaeon]
MPQNDILASDEVAILQRFLRTFTLGVNQTPNVFWQLDKNGKFILSEGGGLEFIGLKPGQVVGISVFDMYKDFPDLLNNHVRALGGEIVSFKMELQGVQHFDGEKPINRMYQFELRPEFEGEEVVGVHGLAQDISDIKKLEYRVKESEMNYRVLFETSPLGVGVFQEGKLIYYNTKLQEIYGFSTNNASDLLASDFVAPEYKNLIQNRTLNREKGGEEPKDYNTKGERADGSIFDLNILASVFTHENNPAVLVIFRDLSTITRLEEEKNELEKRLLMAQKLESLGIVAGGIAHDMNNLLMGILGNASLLKTRELDENSTEILDEIFKISNQATHLTKQILTFTGQSETDKISCNLSNSIILMKKLLDVSVYDAIIVDYDLDYSVNPVNIDISQIQQVMLNLVINASEAIGMKNGNIRIHSSNIVLTDEHLKNIIPSFDITPGEYVMVEVTDDGPGIPDENISKIFDPFFSTKFTGRGLGLSVTMGIIKSHNGAIEVETSQGVGTTFRIYLPKSDKPIIEETSIVVEELVDRSGKILLVDDDTMVRNVTTRMIKHFGFQVIAAENGQIALDKFSSMDDIRIVILDLTMPVLSGRETLKILRGLSNVPVIITSGYSEYSLDNKYPNVIYLQKPFAVEDLKNCIAKALKTV